MQQARKRIAVIDYDYCNPEKCGGYYCEKVCPVNRTGKDCITHEESRKPVISEELCIGCQICEKKCPFGAISIVNLTMDLSEPIHQYGQNLFRLHGLPLPKSGNVVGIVGRNGIGKTTALNILSGKIIPNLGDFKAKPSWENVIEHFRGSDVQKFFEKLSKGGLKVSVKPQAVEALPKVAKGRVRKLLEKLDERGLLEKYAKALDIGKILDRELAQISGGELQKVAICAACLKDADFYFIDEPSSYLDIRERLKVASFIGEIAARGKAVMVVEHDLILLDYLSDFVHLMYGKPGVFGIVSQVKTTREGINTYLEGFSKEENYRFREYEIAFSIRAAAEKKRGTAMAQWPALEKKLGGFSLKVEPNSLSRGEVVGVLGPNGIGKTTFARMLVSEIKPDKGAFETALKISYKPQYIEAPEGKTVEQLFMEEKIDVSLPEIKNSIIRPLDIEMLMQKECSKLSGGELQRAMIALCLARSSDIVLMDEPSANLDVEQRLAVAKAIRSFVDSRGISALIVDHDLLFIDYIADRLMVFDGEPAEHGIAKGPFGMEEGMNMLLKGLGITLRRDMNSKRPRINKQGSQKDMEQKKSGKYYYA